MKLSSCMRVHQELFFFFFEMSTTGRIPLTVSVGFHLSFADGRYGWTRTTAGTVMTSSCGQSSLGELKARLPGGAFTTSLRHERGACSTHFDVFFVEQPGAVDKKKKTVGCNHFQL